MKNGVAQALYTPGRVDPHLTYTPGMCIESLTV